MAKMSITEKSLRMKMATLSLLYIPNSFFGGLSWCETCLLSELKLSQTKSLIKSGHRVLKRFSLE